MLKFDILVHPTFSEPKLKTTEPKPTPKKRWKFPWRINMLAVPKPPASKKYEPPPPEGFKVYGPLDPATEFRSDHLARPRIRKLMENRDAYRHGDEHFYKTITKIINKSWASIYNYYRKILRERRLKKLKQKQAKLEKTKAKGKSLEKIESERNQHFLSLAHPKKLFLPEEIPRKWRALEELLQGLEILASPKVHPMPPPREIGVVGATALLYEATENMIKLAQASERKRQRDPNYDIFFQVKRSALTAKCTPRIEKLAQPSMSMREAKKLEEDKYDPWAISPTALKYKPTPRILELAKPLERE